MGKRRIRHERVVAKTLRKIQLSKIFAGIMVHDDLQDIPENDDMIIFE